MTIIRARAFPEELPAQCLRLMNKCHCLCVAVLSFQPEKLIQSTAEQQKDLTVYVYTGTDASFSLYEDNGITYAYEKGEYSTIPLSYKESGKGINDR